MMRRTALALALSVAACAPPGPLDEPVSEAQEAESLTDPSRENAVRFLEQATFGPRLSAAASPPIDSVEYVQAHGITAAIDAQLAKAPGVFDSRPTVADLGSQFFEDAVDGSDQLRLRVAFALSQILVVSENGIMNVKSTAADENKIAMAGYLNKLRAGAFGSYRDLLETLTRDPAMGRYLNMANNRAIDTAGNTIKPNENYARELLQLFTLGLVKLNDNGTPKLDCDGDGVADSDCTQEAGGMPLPAYTEANVQAFAASLSGWTYAKSVTGTAATDCPSQGKSNGTFYGVESNCVTAGKCGTPMIACDANHDSSRQTLLRNVKTTAGGTAEQHISEALDNIFNDSNLPPFVCKQLIQHLVTSNPSPSYVLRVVRVFKNSTYPTAGGARGDLGAVVRAILSDNEARGPQPPLSQYASYGHLRAPALFVTSMVRWLDGHLTFTRTNDDGTVTTLKPGGKLNTASTSMGQQIPRPPSVFSYYPPDNPAPGAPDLVGPEFGILTTATATARANFVHDLLFGGINANHGIAINVNVLPSDADGMVVWLAQNMLHNAASSDLQLAIYSAITDPRANSATLRRKLAITLAALSPEYQIER